MRKVRDIILICLVGCVQNCANFDANGGYLGVLLVSGGASGGAGSAVPADWWDTSWKKRRRMTIDNSSRGALSDVPVLVQLTSARIDYTSAAADGSDVCFVVAGSSAGSAALSHEIEQWNSSGTSILWLKVPSLAAAASVSIDMYYEGSTCATTASDAWNSNYQTVWHLNTGVTDSSGRANDLVATGATQTTAGLFAGASSFGGTGDQLEDADGENYLNGQTALSFSAWVQATATGSDMGFFYAAVPAGSDNVPGLRHDASGASGTCTICFKGSVDVAGSILQMETSSSIQSTSWAYVTMVWESGQPILFYLNGAVDTPTFQSAGSAGSLSNATTVIIGRGGKDNGAAGWNGLIDEVRISNVAESADWVDAQYKSMTDALITYAAEESI